MNLISKKQGFTLIEIVIVITVMGAIMAIVTPKYFNYVKEAKVTVCSMNCNKVKNEYEMYLMDNDITHSEEWFLQFRIDNSQEVCSENGSVIYDNGKVKCDVHGEEGTPQII